MRSTTGPRVGASFGQEVYPVRDRLLLVGGQPAPPFARLTGDFDFSRCHTMSYSS